MITRYKQDGEKIRYWQGIDNEKQIELEYPYTENPTIQKAPELPAKPEQKLAKNGGKK